MTRDCESPINKNDKKNDKDSSDYNISSFSFDGGTNCKRIILFEK